METGVSVWSVRALPVLAQPTRRKLALLIRINQYANSATFPNLAGCLTDVDLQRELLIHALLASSTPVRQRLDSPK